MRLTPLEPEIPEDGGFTRENDIFSYRDFGERLANLVQSIDEPLVICLDGEWGSGKSVFIRQWAGLLRQRGAPVILFNAFQNDHHEDAFLALSAEILATAKDVLGTDDRNRRNLFDRAKKVGKALLPIGARVAARAGTAGLLSLEDIQAGGEALEAAAKAAGREAEKAVDRVVSERLSAAQADRATLEAFRETLSQLAEVLAERGGNDEQAGDDNRADDAESFPLVFIVDELDRCRPPFALSIIERIKHLFSVRGVCFVLVTHLPQLEQAIQGAYGTKFDAQTYLEKFYHLPIKLPENQDQTAGQQSKYVEYLWEALQLNFDDANRNQQIQQDLITLGKGYGLSLRRLERIITNIALVAAATRSNYLVIPPIVVGLCVMRQLRPDLYEHARKGRLSWLHVQEFLQPIGQDALSEWAINWWKFITNESLDEEDKQQKGAAISRYGVDHPQRVIDLSVQFIDDLVVRRDEDE